MSQGNDPCGWSLHESPQLTNGVPSHLDHGSDGKDLSRRSAVLLADVINLSESMNHSIITNLIKSVGHDCQQVCGQRSEEGGQHQSSVEGVGVSDSQPTSSSESGSVGLQTIGLQRIGLHESVTQSITDDFEMVELDDIIDDWGLEDNEFVTPQIADYEVRVLGRELEKLLPFSDMTEDIEDKRVAHVATSPRYDEQRYLLERDDEQRCDDLNETKAQTNKFEDEALKLKTKSNQQMSLLSDAYSTCSLYFDTDKGSGSLEPVPSKPTAEHLNIPWFQIEDQSFKGHRGSPPGNATLSIDPSNPQQILNCPRDQLPVRKCSISVVGEGGERNLAAVATNPSQSLPRALFAARHPTPSSPVHQVNPRIGNREIPGNLPTTDLYRYNRDTFLLYPSRCHNPRRSLTLHPQHSLQSNIHVLPVPVDGHLPPRQLTATDAGDRKDADTVDTSTNGMISRKDKGGKQILIQDVKVIHTTSHTDKPDVSIVAAAAASADVAAAAAAAAAGDCNREFENISTNDTIEKECKSELDQKLQPMSTAQRDDARRRAREDLGNTTDFQSRKQLQEADARNRAIPSRQELDEGESRNGAIPNLPPKLPASTLNRLTSATHLRNLCRCTSPLTSPTDCRNLSRESRNTCTSSLTSHTRRIDLNNICIQVSPVHTGHRNLRRHGSTEACNFTRTASDDYPRRNSKHEVDPFLLVGLAGIMIVILIVSQIIIMIINFNDCVERNLDSARRDQTIIQGILETFKWPQDRESDRVRSIENTLWQCARLDILLPLSQD